MELRMKTIRVRASDLLVVQCPERINAKETAAIVQKWSKENGVTVPIIFLSHDFNVYRFQGRGSRKAAAALAKGAIE